MLGFLLRALQITSWRAAIRAATFAGISAALAPAAFAAPPAYDLAHIDSAGAVHIAVEITAQGDPALDPYTVVSGAASLPFAEPDTRVPQLRSPDGDVWIRYRLTNSADAPRSAKFVINFSYLERVDLFQRLADGAVQHSTAGSAMPVSGAGIAAAYPAFQMQLPAGETRDYYVRVRSNSILFFPMRIMSENQFSHSITRDTLIWSLIAGTALAFAMYAASMSFGTARGAYRAYLCFGLAAAAYILVSSGLVRALIGSALAINLNTLLYAAQALVIAFGTLFITRFLDLRHVAPRLYTVFILLAGFATLTGVSFLMPPWLGRLSYLVATGLGPLILMLGLGWLTWRRVAGARALLAAWTPCFLATVWMYLRVFNITPYLPINHFIVSLSFAFTLAHLSAILGGRARKAELWANNDMLTGLGNRRLLTAVLELEAHEPSRRYGAAIAIDLDDFKPVNDRHGHAAGDAVLVAVGERLRAMFKGKGDVFRLGGDEFLILCYNSLGRIEIINLAGDYLGANRQPVRFEDQTLTIDASIGVAFRDDHAGLEAMMKQADAELYAVKQAGRGRVRIADQRKQERRKTGRTIGFLPATRLLFGKPGEPEPVAANDAVVADAAAKR
ncbi:MAG: diguanylate cyclase [Hyphomonas sp.]